MSRRPPEPLFLARQSYRRRRLGDAARVLPIVGTVLFLLPVLWAEAGTRSGLVYIFSVWALLILVVAPISARLTDTVPEEDTEGTRTGEDP